MLRTRALLLAVIVVLGGCAPGPEADDARVPAPEVAGHRERLSDGSYVLGDERELTVVTEGAPVRWQADVGAVAVRSEVDLTGARRQVLRLAPASNVLDAVDKADGRVRYRLRVAHEEPAPVLAQAEALKRRGERDRARTLLEAAQGLSPRDEARRSWILGRLALGRGALDEARTLLWRAARGSAETGLASLAVDSANVLAYAESTARAPAGAEEALAFSAPHAVGDAERQADVAFYTSLPARERGDLRRVLEQLAVAERLAERLDLHPLLEDARNAHAIALDLLGRRDEALALAKALLTSDPHADSCVKARLAGNAGWYALSILDLRGPEQRSSLSSEADDLLGQAARAAASCDDPLSKNNAHVNLALLGVLSGNLPRARAELALAREVGAGDAYTAPWRLEIEGRLALAEGDAQAAAAAFTRELALSRASGDPAGSWRSLVGLGRAQRAAGAQAEATAQFDAAERTLDRLAWGVPLGVGRGLLLDDTSASVTELIASLLAQGRCAEAHAAARRALSREESLAATSATQDTLDPQRRAQVEALLQQYRSARDAISREAEGDWALSDAKLSQALAARGERVRASEALLDRALSLTTSQALDRPLSAEAPRAGLLVLTFLPQRDELLAFAHQGSQCRSVRLPNAAIGSAMLAPFSAEIDEAESIELLVPGSLRGLDLHALEVDGQPLFMHAPVAYAIAAPGAKGAKGEERALVVADPTEALPHARVEGKQVADALAARGPVTTLAGPAASRAAVLKALDESSFVHFAGHGRVDGASNLSPRLELAEHGVLTLGDVLGLSRAPRHVVLSACDAGRSTEPSNVARVMGLAQAFVVRGAEQVVAPVRPVDDQASAELIAKLYEAYRRDGDLVLALRDAQLALADSPTQDWKSFRVWVR